MRRPARVPRALLVGLVELVVALVHVLFNILSKVLSTWAKGIAVLSLDGDFAARRSARVELRPARHALQGLAQGLLCLHFALWSACHGVATLPSSGYGRAGARGCCAGALRALLGLAVKPAVGCLDLVAKLCEGVKNTVSVLEQPQRQRPPRVFHADRVLRPFSRAEAHAQAMLAECRLLTPSDGRAAVADGTVATAGAASAAGAPNEYYIDHFRIAWRTRHQTAGAPRLLLVTTARVVLGDAERLRPLWEVALERIARVERRAGHVLLWTWERVGLDALSYAYNVIVERKIQCSDAATLEAIFSRLWAVANKLDGAVGSIAPAAGAPAAPLTPSAPLARGRLVV